MNPTRLPAPGVPGRVRPPRFVLARFLRRLGAVVLSLLLVMWCLPPVILTWREFHPGREALHTDIHALPFPAEAVTFRTADGLLQHGWFGHAGAEAPVILFGHGYPTTREVMIPYAAFLYRAGYNVLLFDWRGWGESEGAETTFGLHESDDLSRAMDYLETRADLHHPRFGGLGVSLGAGLMLLGAAHDHRLVAVVCDSTYAAINGMFSQWNAVGLQIWPYRLSFAPLAEPAANLMLDGRLADLSPLGHAADVSPSALLLIETAHDHNPLTPLSGARQIFAAAREPKALWVAPEGDHAGALGANTQPYEAHVLAFFATYLGGGR